MTLQTACHALHLSRKGVLRTRWHWVEPRPFMTNASPTQWFAPLRREMLGRHINPLISSLSSRRNETLEKSLSSVLPAAGARSIDGNSWLPLGHHLVYFNPYVLEHSLLPDGTDAIHSPGPPFNRRLWAGGRLYIDVIKYYSGPSQWKLQSPFVCLERITDVQLRGEGAAAKIFITIQRRFANIESLDHYRSGLAGRKQTVQDAALLDGFRNEPITDEDWGSASMIEERDIVFLKDRAQDELDAFKAGEFPPVKYLKSLSQPDFSHTLIPTPSLLSKYSELTLNAHHIHLDTNYARNVEGHRNLLVHGPLSLTLILRLVNNHLAEQRGPPQTVRSIDYRNIAPLYCDEELTLCGRRRDRLDENGHPVFDVWIEGPTGGMAVKGTVHTSPMHYRGSFSAALRLTRHKDGDEGDKRSQGEVAGTLNAPQPPPELKPKSRSKPKPKPRSESKPEYKTISQLLLEANEKYAHLPRKQRRRLFAHEKNRLLQLRTAKNATTNPDAETKPKRKSRPVAAEFPSNPSDPVLALLSDPPLAPTPPQPASQPDDADADVEEKKISYIDRPLPIRYYDTDMEHNAWKKEGRVDLNEDGTPRSIFADRGVTKVFPVRARKVAAMQLGRRWDFSELYSFSAARAMIGRSRRRSLFEKQSRLDGWSGDQDGTSAGVEKSEVWGDRFGGWVSDRDRVVRVRKYEVSGGRGMERGGVRARARREEREERQRRGYEQRYEDAGEEIVDLSSPEEKKKKKNNWRPGSTSLDADGAQELRNLSREEKKISQPGAAPLASYEEPKLRIRKQFYPLITKYRD